jgi:hypothetical protein
MTNLIVVKEVDQFMADYVPVYQPIYGLFLGKAKQYSSTVGSVVNRRLTAVGDIRAKHVLPKDTDLAQFSAVEKTKSYKKYFLSNQFVNSELQDSEGVDQVAVQVLDEHQKQMDDLLFLGEGTAANNVINNGLFWSGDSNYTLETSSGLVNASDNHLSAMHTAIVASAAKANKIAGRKVLFIYGSGAKSRYNSLYSTSMPFKEALAKVLGANWSVVEVPDDVAITGNGWIAVNLDQVMFHYSLLPQLKKQGVNDEKGYSWHKFMLSSCMLEVLAMYAIVRQPVTFA